LSEKSDKLILPEDAIKVAPSQIKISMVSSYSDKDKEASPLQL
jgi:hypothetical protein